jgi:hypothetical protein
MASIQCFAYTTLSAYTLRRAEATPPRPLPSKDANTYVQFAAPWVDKLAATSDVSHHHVYSSGEVMVTAGYTVAQSMAAHSALKQAAAAAATSSNVCKVKPQQQAVLNSGPSPIRHHSPLSPPLFNSSTQQGHI